MGTELIGKTLMNQFRVDAFIASGGMGAVYRVWDLKRNVPLAMKVLHADLSEDPAMFKRFKREASALKKLAHPNIVPFYGLYETRDFAFMLERYVDGSSLKDVLRKRQGKPMSVEEGLVYLKALSAALGYAHANGVVHCDVKPGNVMVDQGGNIYLTDFGIARHTDSTTTTLATVGTAAYMAPEQIRGEAVSPVTDVYALGVMFFEMLTGQRPYKGDEKGTESGGSTANERIRYAQIMLPPPDPRLINPSLSGYLSLVISKALHKDPTQRFPQVRDLYLAVCEACGYRDDEISDRLAPTMETIGEGELPHGSERKTTVRRSLRVPAVIIGVCVIVSLAFLATRLTNFSFHGASQAPDRIIQSTRNNQTGTFGPGESAISAQNYTSTVTPTPSITPKPTITPTPSPSPTPSPDFTWSFSIVDGFPKTGRYTSLAIDSNGTPQIAYLHDENDELNYATYSQGNWHTRMINSNYRVGWYNSLALDSQNQPHLSSFLFSQRDNIYRVLYGNLTNTGWQFEVVANARAGATSLAIDQKNKPHIAYFDTSTDMIYYLTSTGNGWTKSEVGAGNELGIYFPIAVDLQDQPHICYYGGVQGLVYASLQGNRWTFKTIDPGSGIGLYPSLVFDNSGNPHISYYDENRRVLKQAYWDGITWQITIVDNSLGVGKYTSTAIDKNGTVHISYYDEANSALKYAFGSGNAWNIYTVDTMGNVGKENSIALDQAGNPHISYYDETSYILKYAVGEISSSPNPSSNLSAFYQSGQTFLTWFEQSNLEGERYRIYRSINPISASNISQATLLAELPKNSANFYANRYHDVHDNTWHPRYSDRLIIQDDGIPLPLGTGLFVWTISLDEFGGNRRGNSYYAMTVKPENGAEIVTGLSAIGPIAEEVADPLPVEITQSSGVSPGSGGHVYIQYMDFYHWNPTFHAPNTGNSYYGLDPADPSLDGSIQYAYDYMVYSPTIDSCGGSLPQVLPVIVSLHGWRENRYKAPEKNPYSYCSYSIFPIDTSETWYFGFARDHDYRVDNTITKGDVIENFTEQRILRMIYDLIRNPPGPAVDVQRVYIFGHSMGGSGALAFAERYPNVFAAAYSSQPITNYRTAGLTDAMDPALIWGKPELNLPILISGPGDWAAHLQKFDGIGVWDWQNYQESLPGGNLIGRAIDDMVPLGIDLGIPDHVIKWDTQGEPIYAILNASHQAWGGVATNQDHDDAWVLSDIGFPPSLKSQRVPFWNLSIIKDETVPGLSNLSSNPGYVPQSAVKFNQTLKWSSSWDPWDGTPIDTPYLWQISICSVANNSKNCGTGIDQTVDITPRRVQNFIITPNAEYDWESRRIADNEIIARGSVFANADGLVTIMGFTISSSGTRLVLRPHTNLN